MILTSKVKLSTKGVNMSKSVIDGDKIKLP